MPPPHIAGTSIRVTHKVPAGMPHVSFTPLKARWIVALAVAGAIAVTPAFAQQGAPETRPYDDRLMRLAEVLGAVHFLRELCGGNDGMQWRDRMRELMDAEGSSALRRSKLTRAFNLGYRSYSRTYSTCTPSAQTAISRFFVEGVDIADGLVKNIP
jgi:uncharacterized protein (TIGR02301 family)